MQITIYAVLIWLAAILIGSLNLVIFLGSNKLSSRAFAFSIFWVTAWVAAVGFFICIRDYHNAEYAARLTYYLGSTIAASFLYFFFTFPDNKKPSKYFSFCLVILQLIFAYVFLFTDSIINTPIYITSPSEWGWHFGPLSFLFEFFFFGFFSIGIIILFRKYKRVMETNAKKNLKFMLLTVLIGAFPPSLMSIVLPRFGYFDLNWLGPVTEIIWIPILSYSILKYQQMNIRAVVTEVLAIGMTVVFFINIFIGVVPNIWMRAGTFLFFIVLAFYLIRISLREATQREELSDLNHHLSEKVAEQTAEIRRAYELEKRARRELEKLNETKDQFIMITQHHLRTPVTSIRWELEEIMRGAYGPVNPELGRALTDTNTAVGRLIRIVDDFLSITSLKVGKQILDISSTNMLPILEDVLQELKVEIERRHLTVELPREAAQWPDVPIDAAKMREVLLIILENAVKYNHDGGRIPIATKRDGKMFGIQIDNTGLGFDAEDKQRIFSSLFYRSEAARRTNPVGMGVGLSVARAIVRAHHGELTIASEGKDKGARATITVPLL